MLHLFVRPTSFEGCGDYPFDGTTLSQLLAGLMLIFSLGALALTLCRALLMLAIGDPVGFGPPPSLHVMLSM